jgi:hypothetical protein
MSDTRSGWKVGTRVRIVNQPGRTRRYNAHIHLPNGTLATVLDWDGTENPGWVCRIPDGCVYIVTDDHGVGLVDDWMIEPISSRTWRGGKTKEGLELPTVALPRPGVDNLE